MRYGRRHAQARNAISLRLWSHVSENRFVTRLIHRQGGFRPFFRGRFEHISWFVWDSR